ncbi:hypothetical protein, partial [Pseudovibrio sp. W74]|uniref:hypothetical protein n=1 Tax=Pseudovibrio sp. W74 TaxID=1735584 RepID=UPI0019D355D5
KPTHKARSHQPCTSPQILLSNMRQAQTTLAPEANGQTQTTSSLQIKPIPNINPISATQSPPTKTQGEHYRNRPRSKQATLSKPTSNNPTIGKTRVL